MKNRNLKLLDIKKVILNWAGVRLALQNLPRMLLPLRKNNDKSGRFQIKFGMTFFNNAATTASGFTASLVTPQECSAGYSEARHGFTLIELLVVVLIIGILAAVAVPQYKVAVAKSRATEGIIIIQTWYEALKRYHLENGVWPATKEEALSALDVDIPTPKYGKLYYFPNDWIYYISPVVTISRIFAPPQSSGVTRGLTCHTQETNKSKLASDLGAKVCKSLCGTDLKVLFSSGQYGCAIK